MKKSKKRIIIAVALVLTIVAAIWFFSNKSQNGLLHPSQTYSSDVFLKQANFESIADFAPYINSYTAGYIKPKSEIKIIFALPIPHPLTTEEILSFEPAIKGSLHWESPNSLVFMPAQPMPKGTLYKAKLKLSKLIGVPKNLETFNFSFAIQKQAYSINPTGWHISTEDTQKGTYKGLLTLAVEDSDEKIEKTITATVDEKKHPVVWEHNGTQHTFSLKNINHKAKNTAISIFFDAAPIGIDKKETLKANIPGNDDLKLMAITTKTMGEQTVELVFNNPVQKNRISSYFDIKKFPSMHISPNGNRVTIYPTEPVSGNYTLTIYGGLQDALGHVLPKPTEHLITFEETSPAFRLLTTGTILPTTGQNIVGFEAINLRAVDVFVFRIYESNVPQFFQVNNYDENSEMERVGKLVASKTIKLIENTPGDFKHWKKYGVDLSELITVEPGAIYNIKLTFNPLYTTWPCDGAPLKDINISQFDKPTYRRYDIKTPDYLEPYDWNKRDLPCNEAYYTYRKCHLSTNLLATDLGITAKLAKNKTMLVAVANLINTQPEADVEITIYDQQLQKISSGTTNKNGFCYLTIPEQDAAFLVKGKKGNQTSYCRLQANDALPNEMFNTEGMAVNEGLKCFIYAERGIWRPGDTIHANIILQTLQQATPEYFPVAAKVTNPTGQEVFTTTLTQNTNGFYNLKIPTAQTDQTGNYTASIKTGGTEFTKIFKVETIKPNRLSVDLNIPENDLILIDDSVALQSKWLTGASATGLTAKVNLTLQTDNLTFEDHPDYEFNDPTQSFFHSSFTAFSGKLNNNGSATFTINYEAETETIKSGVLKATFNTKVYEPGGGFSISTQKARIMPHKLYVGLKTNFNQPKQKLLHTGQKHKIEIITVNKQGQKTGDGMALVQVFKLDWSWWWEQNDYGMANYASKSYHTPLVKQNVSLTNGKGMLELELEDHQWGRYLIHVQPLNSDHSCGQVVYFDWANWMERNNGDINRGAQILNFTTDKKTYKTGEKITVTVPSPPQSRLLATVETGSQVLQANWITQAGNQKTFSFEATKSMAPNAYIYISAIQPHAQTANSLPIRTFGLLPIEVIDQETKLHPKITMPNNLKPKSKVTIKVSEDNGKPCTYTLALVDEGLLGITRFKTPAPHQYFYAKEALGINTFDVYDHVLGAYGAQLEQILSIGGDGINLNASALANMKRFKPIVIVKGPYKLAKGATNTHTVQLPNYVGAVRAMVVAGQNTAYGNAEKTVTVKNPLMVLANLPRVLAPNDKVTMPVSVFAMDKSIKKVSVSVKTNDIIKPKGSTTQSVSFEQVGDQMANFDLVAGRKTGVANIKIDAKANGEYANSETQIKVVNPSPLSYQTANYLIDAGTVKTIQYAMFGEPGTQGAKLEVSSMPAINLTQRINYLIKYPHGCSEQVTSAAMAQLYLENLTELTDAQKQATTNHVSAAIDQLKKYQTAFGGFSIWPNSPTANDWVTSYIGHFLVMAKEKGYKIPANMFNNWKKYHKKNADHYNVNNNGTNYNVLNQAYRLYTLALAGAPAQSAMNRLKVNTAEFNTAKWLLAAAYAVTGSEKTATTITQQATTQTESGGYLYQYFGSELRNQAIILDCMLRLGKKTDAVPLFTQVAQSLGSQSWHSTQSTAFGLYAAARFFNNQTISNQSEYAVKINDQTIKQKPVKNGISIVELPTNGTKLSINNTGKGALYARVTTWGVYPHGHTQPQASNLKLALNYTTENGTPINPKNLKQGQSFIMEATVTNPGTQGNYENMVLEQLLPSGWEVLNSRLDASAASQTQGSAYQYQDVRDSKVYTYFNLQAGKSKTFKIMLNASFLGAYYLPPTTAYHMYNNSIAATLAGHPVTIEPKIK